MLTFIFRTTVGVFTLCSVTWSAPLRGGGVRTSHINVDLGGLEKRTLSQEPIEVWISSFPRSASSTVLTMVGVSGGQITEDGTYDGANVSKDVFTLFEPCHLSDVPFNEDCTSVVADLANCNFAPYSYLWGWDDVHTANGGQPYSIEVASNACHQASIRGFKTVGQMWEADYRRRLVNMVWVLDIRPSMKILNLVRDPRSILASWTLTSDFDINPKRQVPAWQEICDTFALNMDVKHPRVYTVVYENIVHNATAAMKNLYSFLGIEFGNTQQQWINLNFPDKASQCPHSDKHEFADCQGRDESFAGLESWRGVLSEDDKKHFKAYEPCQKVFSKYGYPAS